MTAPIQVQVTRYACPSCSHRRASKKASVDHIGRCWFNPATRACTTCGNYEPGGSGEQCIPGQNCNCNNQPHGCAARIPLPDGAAFPLTGCPSWVAREGDE